MGRVPSGRVHPVVAVIAAAIVAFLSVPVHAQGDAPAKIRAIFPAEATKVNVGGILKMGFMVTLSPVADIPNTRDCSRKSEPASKGMRMDIHSFNTGDQMGKMQMGMFASGGANEISAMKEQLSKDLAGWKSNASNRCGAFREEAVKGGKLFMISRDSMCYESENASYHEVKAKCYFNNGRTVVKMEVACRSDDDRVRAMVLDTLKKIDGTDFSDMMKP